MTTDKDSDTPDSTATSAPDAERIAKVMARAGVASRRDAERLILAGRVAVNGKVVKSPALDVVPSDRVTLDGKPIDEKQPTRLWLYYKPLGLVTSEKDEKGRQTVFDSLPEGMPRVMSIGRLDLNSEGLLLLTNDGELKRRLEMPATGWLRKYRVRVNGTPNDATFDPLRRGITIDGEDFQPMEITLDRQKGANAWLTVGIREGKNREIRRAMTEVGLTVNRLIRVSYGPFRLNEMQLGEVSEVRRRVLRDQLGSLLTGEEEDAPARPPRAAGAKFGAKGGPRTGAPRRPFSGEGERPPRPRPVRDDADAAPRGDRKPYEKREGGGDRPSYGKPYAGKPRSEGAGGDRPSYGKPAGDRPRGDKPGYGKPYAGKPRSEGTGGDRPSYGKPAGDRPRGDKPGYGKPYAGKPRSEGTGGDRPSYGKPAGDRPRGGKPGYGKPYAGKPRSEGTGGDRPSYGKPAGDRPRGDKPGYGKPYAGKPRSEGTGGDRPSYGKPAGDRPRGDKPGYGKPGGAPGKGGPRGSGGPRSPR